MSACRDCTRPAEVSAWDLCLPGKQGEVDMCRECASRRCMVQAEESVARMKERIQDGRIALARAAADEAGSWFMGAVEAWERAEAPRIARAS